MTTGRARDGGTKVLRSSQGLGKAETGPADTAGAITGERA